MSSTATLTVALAAQPVGTTIGEKEVVEVFASIRHHEQLPLLLRTYANREPATALLSKTNGDLLLVTGELSLDQNGDIPVLMAWSLCAAYENQYFNEVTLIGRATSAVRSSESNLSSSRTLGVNRFLNREPVTDWFKVRGFGRAKEDLEKLDKGTLAAVNGTLSSCTNAQGKPYCEIKARKVKPIAKPSGSSSGRGPNPAAGTAAAGYSHDDFTNLDSPPEGAF